MLGGVHGSTRKEQARVKEEYDGEEFGVEALVAEQTGSKVGVPRSQR